MPETTTVQRYGSRIKPIWCPGCGDYGVKAGILKAITDLGLDRARCYSLRIGCSSAMPHSFTPTEYTAFTVGCSR